ncbi:MAG: hypothetical protein ACK48E_02840 [Holosporales bacterium]
MTDENTELQKQLVDAYNFYSYDHETTEGIANAYLENLPTGDRKEVMRKIFQLPPPPTVAVNTTPLGSQINDTIFWRMVEACEEAGAVSNSKCNTP